jgi:hypothetical protein
MRYQLCPQPLGEGREMKGKGLSQKNSTIVLRYFGVFSSLLLG